MKKILFCCFLLMACLRGVARSYYVAAVGNDQWDGSRAHPWKTIGAVNRFGFSLGDSVLFRGGEHFRGTLRFDGRMGLTVASYGNGAAIVDAGDSSAIVLYRCTNFRVVGLRLVGAGRKTGNVRDGLAMLECIHCRAEGVDVTGFQKSGLLIWSCVDIEVKGIVAHENGSAGISVEGQDKKSSREIRILNCRADDNPGDPTNLTNHSGNGIVCGHCTNVLIERCSATNNGWDMPRIGNGPVGIWCYEADSVVIRYCLSYKNKTSPGAADGGGFDLDGGVTHSVIEYCLSYGNQGAGYCLFQYWSASPWHDNVIHDNISEDDGLVSDGRAGIYVWNSSGDATQLRDCRVYNNTIYNSHEAAISFSEKSERMGFVFSDNIFVGRDSLIKGDHSPRDGFRGNGWWLLKGTDHRPADVLERGTALFADPRFRSPGNTVVTDVRGMEGYSKYQLLAGSVMKGKGAAGSGAAGASGAGTAAERFLDDRGNFINAHGAGVLFYEGVYYLFGEIKSGPTRLVPGQSWEDYRVEAGGVSCYSSTDLRHWKYEGVALKPEMRDTASDIFTGRVIERPKVIYNEGTKKFVLWMHIDREDYGSARVGVAVSDRPQGPYRYLESFRPNGQESRDMTVFKDEDGRAYLVYASEQNNTLHVCLLSKDYLSPTAVDKRLLIDQRREAPAVFRHGARYYLISSLCSGWDANPARWAVADSMLGEWRQQGNPCAGVDSATTYHSQSSFVLMTGRDRFLFMADRWNKTDLERSTYLWAPLRVEDGRVVIEEAGASPMEH